MSAWKPREGILALLIGIILIAGIILAVIAFVPLSPFEHHDAGDVELGDADTLHLTVDADVTDVVIIFKDLGTKALRVELDIDGRTGFLSGEPEVALTVDDERAGGVLSIDIVLDMDTGPTVGYELSDLVIFIDHGLRTAMDVSVDVGDVFLGVALPVELDGGSIYAKVGAVNVDLSEGASILGDLYLKSGVGSVSLVCASSMLSENVNIDLSTKTGSVFLGLYQFVELENNATFRCQTDTGSINLELMIIGDTGAEITSQADVGDINTDLTGFSGMDVHLESDNYPDERNLTIFLQSDVGSINIDAEWSG